MKTKVWVTLKTMTELLGEGWSPSTTTQGLMNPPPGKKWWSVKDITMLGTKVQFSPSLGGGYMDAKGRMWSSHAVSTIWQAQGTAPVAKQGVPVTVAAAPKCTCDIKVMCDMGCQCGAFKAEMASKRNQSVTLH